MKKRIINVASVGAQTTGSMLDAIARSTARVSVFSAMHGRELGFCERYWRDGEDLWAEAQLVDDAPEDFPGVHAEAVLAMRGVEVLLCAVVLTTLPRGMLHQAALGKPFLDAVRAVVAERFGNKGPRMKPEDWPPLEGIPDNALQLWTIYDHPLDYPDFWVVRRSFGVPDEHGEPIFDVVPRLASSLAEARSFVPWGRYRQPREEADDPFIVEVWF